MSFFKPIWQIFISIWQWLKANFLNVLLAGFVVIGIVGGIDGYLPEGLRGGLEGFCFNRLIGQGTPISLVEFGGFIISIIALILLYKRTSNQDKQLSKQQTQIQFQVDKEVDDSFTSAITLLGSNQTSARTGALYVLYDLAIKNDKYRKQVAEIMCAHIRGHTQMPKYKKENKEKPSAEIQTAINLLFIDSNGVKGIYYQDFASILPPADLSFSFLRGARFGKAKLINARFYHAECQGADFRWAECQGANFRSAKCQDTFFVMTKCQGADFIEAKCQRAKFWSAQCQGAYFRNAKCHGAGFIEAECQGADFSFARCQGVYFMEAKCQGTVFFRTKCQGANFMETQCQGAVFMEAKCHGANFSYAKCQGAHFTKTQCQGTIASEENDGHDLSARVGMDTVLENLVFSGGLEDDWLDKLQYSVKVCGTDWFEDMKKIHEEHSNKPADYTLPEGIITGVLEDTEEIQKIIAEITKIRSSNDGQLFYFEFKSLMSSDKTNY